MKTYCLFITLFVFTCNKSSGEIKNGYGTGINIARESLKGLNSQLNKGNHLSLFERSKIKFTTERLIKFIAYFELTENLLQQFRTISPDLYAKIDSIKDRNGRRVDVYVKFVHEDEMPPGVAGSTNLAQMENDKDAYTSFHGPHTVSVRVRTEIKSLLLLAHEFGHVNYQVPNLAEYVDFYTKHYQDQAPKKSKGHNSNDLSGQNARDYEKRCRDQYLTFQKKNKNKLENPMVLLEEFKRKRTRSI